MLTAHKPGSTVPLIKKGVNPYSHVSLVPHEMLAAGCIPVVNDAVHNRIVLDNRFVRYAPPNSHSLAAELETPVTIADFDSLSRRRQVYTSATWNDAGAAVDAIFRRVLGARHVTVRGGDGPELASSAQL